jgi:predicted nucleotidyltransferase
MKPHNESSNFAKVKFPDHEKILSELTALAQQAIRREPKIRAVYLFGSRAAGNFSARSDADLLVILQNDTRPPLDRIPHYLELFQQAPVPVDVFPYTMEEVQQNAFARRALQTGLLLSLGK